MAKLGRVSIDRLSDAIMEELKDYAYVANTAVDKAVVDTAKELSGKVQAEAPVKTGTYKGQISYEESGKKGKAGARVFVDGDRYRIAHLLEKGHRIVDVNHRLHGTTKPIPHIAYGEALAQRRLPELIEEEMRKT